MSLILLVEDADLLADSIAQGLQEEGFTVAVCPTGRCALTRATAHDLDAVVLDLGLPDLDGADVLLQLRAAGEQMPILVLTARDAVAARVQVLEAGADDYLVKPFAFAELLARIRALLRRVRAPRWAPLACGDLRLDAGEQGILVGERAVHLSPRERDLLEYFLRRQGEVVTRAGILRDVFGYEFDPGTNVLDVHMAHLRKKLLGSSTRLETVRGRGFRLLSAGGK
jgi:two-component system OmpR family response regulator